MDPKPGRIFSARRMAPVFRSIRYAARYLGSKDRTFDPRERWKQQEIRHEVPITESKAFIRPL
jgi:hypothetical protein